ncbi:MAG: transposase [Nitrospira sp.]|nr:transposase [Nitrospira sp.]
MAKSRFTHDQIMAVIDEMSRGLTLKDLSRKYGVSTTTLSRWRVKLADRKPSRDSEFRDRLQLLETENRRLKRKFAELALDYTFLRAALIHEGTKDC